MKKPSIRILSIVLALLLTLQVSPLAFATAMDEEEPTEIVEAVPEEVVEEAEETEEEAEEVLEEIAEEPAEEILPEETEEPAEEAEINEEVNVRFVFEAEYSIVLTQGEDVIAPKAADETTVSYQLAPGSYAYTVKMRGHIGTAEGTLEVTEDMEAITITPELEKYPYGIPGLALDAQLGAINAEVKDFLTEKGISELMPGLVPGVDYVSDKVIIVADDEAEAMQIAEAYGAELESFNYGMGVLQLKGLSVAQAMEASMIEELALPAVEPDYIVTFDDPESTAVLEEVTAAGSTVYGVNSWRSWMDTVGSKADTYLKNPGASEYPYILDRMNMYKAWGVVTGDASVRLVVIDSGLATHTELNKVGSKGYDSSYFSSSNDDNGHGTLCAGIAAAAMGNGAGMAGIAPGVTVYPYKAMNANGGGATSSLVKGINWAIDTARADVISISSSGYYPDYSYEYAIRKAVDAGITVVVAIGNGGSNMKSYPAGYNVPGMIVVGATDAANNRAPYSNFGSWCDIMAPGSNILSTSANGSNSYQYLSGTSSSTPAVAGACALFMSRFGHRTVAPKDMEKMVKAAKTNGILDVYKLVSKKYTPKYLGYSLMSAGEDVTAKYDAATRLPQNLDINLISEDKIVYTLDGTLPGFMNGQLTNGMIYENVISLADFSVGEDVQINAAATNGEGEMGEVLSLSFTIVAVNENEIAPEVGENTPVVTEPEETTDAEAVYDASTSKKINAYYSSGGYEYSVNSKTGVLNTIYLYSTQSPNYNYQYHATVSLRDQYGSSLTLHHLTTTSKNVVINGKYVEAIPGKTGTATIKAYDNYGRSTSFKVKVINPVSRIDISPKNQTMGNVSNVLAVGKSASHKIVLGNTYGKPSTKGVYWVGELFYTDGSKTWTLGKIDNQYNKSNPYFSLSNSGKLTIKKSLQDHPYFKNINYTFYVDVYAQSKDGTNIKSNVVEYLLQMPVTFVGIRDGYYLYKNYSDAIEIRGDMGFIDYEYGMNNSSYTYNDAVVITSDKPDSASVTYATDSNGNVIHNTLRVYIKKPGKVTITIKANDGSNKTAKLRLTIKNFFPR